MKRLDAYAALTAHVAEQARRDAERLRAEATTNFRMTIGLALGFVVVAFGLAVVVARSIDRPLLGLATRAARVSEGDLDVPTASGRGPRELQAVSATMDEVVDNLRLVEAQLGSLAAGRVDDEIVGQPVPGRLGAVVHGSVAQLSRSIAEREELARRLAFDASHDALTGLPNRASTVGVIAHALARSHRPGRGVAVLHVHLEGLKLVNDPYGHEAGDRTVRVTAERILACVRAGDVVTRIGGDDLAVVA
jgi:predicted signal transduction protein with EAL and GGDEF domain